MTNVTQPMIRIDGLTKRYGETEALRGVSFEVPRGQVVGLLGPNGAGKSTTMRILAGFVTPTSGKTFVGGLDVAVDPVNARRRVGYLPENNPLYDEMMVREYLDFIAEIRAIPKAQRAQRIRTVAEKCGLTQVMGKDIGQLSKGYKQRVGLAQAILHDPDLLILDEPTSGLDPNQIVEIRALIKELGREKTVILSTHILPEVQSTCDRVLIINAGKLVADDAPERLTQSDSGRVRVLVANRLGTSVDEAQVRATLSAIPGVIGVDASENEGRGTVGFVLRTGSEDVRRALFEAAVNNDLALLEVHRQQVSLEDTFRKLTTSDATAIDSRRGNGTSAQAPAASTAASISSATRAA